MPKVRNPLGSGTGGGAQPVRYEDLSLQVDGSTGNTSPFTLPTAADYLVAAFDGGVPVPPTDIVSLVGTALTLSYDVTFPNKFYVSYVES